MKKQIHPSIKAHLLWSALILLSLFAICAIPFALAQSRGRGTTKQSVTQAASKQNAAANIGVANNAPPSTGAVGAVSAQTQQPNISRIGQSQLPALSNATVFAPANTAPYHPPVPAAPNVVLYDQINNPAPTPGGVTSQDFEAAFDPFDSFAADDIVVPAGQTWTITEVDVAGEYSSGGGPAASFHVFFYSDTATLPGALVATRLANPYVNGANANITLTSPVILTPGTYWVAVQARQDDVPAGQWFWDNRLVISNSGAAWQNPANGFGTGCTTYGRKTTCLPTQNGPDQLFRLVGTLGGVCTNYVFSTSTGNAIVPGTTDTGNHID